MKRIMHIILGLLITLILPIIGEAVAPVAPQPEPVEVQATTPKLEPTPTPTTSPENTKPTPEPEPVEQESELISIGTFTVTAYCSCEKCCGKWALDRPGGIVYTASGAEAKEGITVGADWDTIASGTEIYIEGIGWRTVQDKPAAWVIEKYDGRSLDLYFENHADAWNFGKQELEVFIQAKK